MGSGEAESCCSSGPEQPGSAQPKQSRLKLDIYTKVLQRVRDSDLARHPGFEDELWAHFNRLPARYSIDFNLERAEDVFMHMKLLKLSVDPENRPVFHIRVVQAPVIDDGNSGEEPNQLSKKRVHPPPMFGSSCNLEALASESNDSQFQDGDSISHGTLWAPRPMHEITFSSDDKPKLLSQLTSLLSDLNLNIQEAHAFSTNDGHSLDVFLVHGWRYEETEQLEQELRKGIHQIKAQSSVKPPSLSPLVEQVQNSDKTLANHVQIPTDGSDVWEIDFKLLKCESKVASGTYGDLYKGTYCSQDVAIKVLKPERVNSEMQREFRQEVFIMRKIRHKNVVQFIGACTKPPIFCIITEYMSGGSLYDILHKQKESFKLPILLRIAIDVSKGMSYLHQNNIIHRDLKTANLLMDENQVVKVADFGVARVKSPSGVMTAETGTYRWMAPEVIEHKRYDHKADVFSFGIVLWELLTGQIPYERYTPLQAAVGVVQKGLRPMIPKNTNPKLAKLLEECWQQDPRQRPDFTAILLTLHNLAKEVKDIPEKTSGKILSKFGFGSK